MDNSCYHLNCANCGKEYEVTKRQYIQRRSKLKQEGIQSFCSHECRMIARGWTPRQMFICANCGKEFKSEYTRTKNKSGNRFCCQSCAASYNNTHKTTGNRRSKLEEWLEEQLAILYPSLEIIYNDKNTINSELDIYIPSLKMAFELNGIFHYEPIYGDDKLQKIQENDDNKFHKCYENKISLCVIDTSEQRRFTIKSSQKYLHIITKIIDEGIKIMK